MRTCAIFHPLHVELETAPTFPCVGASRRVLAWRVFNALATDFCLDAVREAITQDGGPKIFHTDQGCQFTSHEFTGLLTHHGIQISMDGTGCWRDNVFVE
jgi:putative transposase